MRRTNTDYKFSEETPNLHYLSTHSLKSNDNNENTPSNLEFNYYFNHLCHIDDNIDICHKATLSNTYESGIGSSISSIDVHCNLSVTSEESSVHVLDLEHFSPGLMCNNIYSHFDYHDLPPVTEEEDIDSMFGIFNSAVKDNKHLNELPWHEKCCDCASQSHKYKKLAFSATDTKKSSLLNNSQWWEYFPMNETNDILDIPEICHEDHIERPWISNTSNFVPVLSSVCHKSADCIIKSESFLTHLTNTNMISNKAMMYKVFQRRHSAKNGSSVFTYNIRSLITTDSPENENLDDDEYFQSSLSD